MMEDTYNTISDVSSAEYSEKRSKFIAYALPVSSLEGVKEMVENYKKEYYNARHVCWAYMLGAERVDFRSNDDGEPSGTAGKPILGQINSNNLTDILIVVVRYFGGIKLGTGGLIVAYREAAALALAETRVIEKTVDCSIRFRFEYVYMNDVMRIVKDLESTIVEQAYDDTNCIMVLSIRKGHYNELVDRLKKVESIKIDDKACE